MFYSSFYADTKSGIAEIKVTFSDANEVEFYAIMSAEDLEIDKSWCVDKEVTFGVTNKFKNPTAVVRKISNIILSWMKMKNPPIVTFTYDSEARLFLYEKIFKKINRMLDEKYQMFSDKNVAWVYKIS